MGPFESFTGLLLIVLLFVTLTNQQNETLAHNEGKLHREDARFIDSDNVLNFALHFFYEVKGIFSIYKPDQFNQIKPLYKPQYKNVFVVHGWRNSWPRNRWIDQMKEMVFEKQQGKVNFFIVDWAELSADLSYRPSRKRTKMIGFQLANFIAFIKEKFSADMDSVHLIGHSLGAHVCGFAGKRLQKNGITIGKITGLDPAGPGFTVREPEERLDRDDAKLVEVLHTNMADATLMGFGNILKLGDVDIFLNGGARQKGCQIFTESNYDDYVSRINAKRFEPPSEDEKNRTLFELDPRGFGVFACHHSRAVKFYLETRKPNSPCQHVAYQCDLYKNFLDGKCATCGDQNEKCRLFEYNPDTRLDVPLVRGYSYFMETNPREPFCAYHYQLQIHIGKSNFKRGGFKLLLKGDMASEEFELTSDKWDQSYFTTLITTQKYLGNLDSATGRFKWTWINLLGSKIKFNSMNVNYLSHMDPQIRQKLSANFIGHPSTDGNHHFTLPYHPFQV